MELLTKTEAHTSLKQDNIVEIKLWEIYLLYHPAQLYKELREVSLDNGPFQNDPRIGRVEFRFTAEDWENNIKQLLYQYKIPVVIKSNHFQAVKAKGRQMTLNNERV